LGSSQRTVELLGASSIDRMTRKYRVHLSRNHPQSSRAQFRSDFLTCIIARLSAASID
jgi:hypothetical protein